MIDADDRLPPIEMLVRGQLEGVERRPGGDARLAQAFHGLAFRVPAGPRRDHFVDRCRVGSPADRVSEARIVLQVRMADHVKQTLPLVVACAGRVDEHVIVGPAGPARVNAAGRRHPQLALIPPPLGGAPRE